MGGRLQRASRACELGARSGQQVHAATGGFRRWGSAAWARGRALGAARMRRVGRQGLPGTPALHAAGCWGVGVIRPPPTLARRVTPVC